MNKIIVISGKQYSGKDTLAKILLKQMKGFKRIGIGDAIKIEYGKQNNLTFEQIEKEKHLYRNDLIALGNWGRSQDKNYWLNNLSNMDKIIVPDVRVLDEINFFKEKNAFLVRVNSSLENRSKRGIVVNSDDNTEIALDDYKDWNIVVDNNSTYEELVEKSKEVVRKFEEYINK